MNRLQQMTEKILGPKYTFATLKVSSGRFILLARKRLSEDKYQIISYGDGTPVGFATKTSAHSLAREIDEIGLDATGFILGDCYES